MQIITLTTDTGLQDYYVAAIKGEILKEIPNANIIDISHTIKPFDVASATFQLLCCYKDFPIGTIHIVGVDSEPILNGENQSFPTILNFNGHIFICNDNGFFGSLLEGEISESLYRYSDIKKNEDMWQFTTKNCFVPLATKIAKNIPIASFTEKVFTYKKVFIQKPIIDQFTIQGIVIHIDSFGNLITNISRADFNRFGDNTPFTIRFVKGQYFIDKISKTYNAVQNGELVALFNSTDHLEIALNRGANESTGGADRMFGMRIDSVIQVKFEPAGSQVDFNSLL